MTVNDSQQMVNAVNRPIAIGVLLDWRLQERWVLDSLRQALAVPGSQLAAVALVSVKPRDSFAERLHGVFDQVDQRMRCRGDPLFAVTDVVAALSLPPLEIAVVRRNQTWYPDDAGLVALKQCEADVWFCFSAVPCRLPRAISQLGVWGMEIGQGNSATNVWAGAMEVGTSSAVTMVSMVDYAEDRNSLLYRSFGATASNSPRQNRLRAIRKGMSFFKRLLEHLTQTRDEPISIRPATLPVPLHYPMLPGPTISALLQIFWRLVSNWVTHRLPSNQQPEQWQIAFYFSDEDEAGCRFERLHYLVPPKDRFWADPIAVEQQGRYFIFFEELPYHTQKGRVMVIEVFEDAEPVAAQVALERPYHLSYPFVFSWKGSLYMLPETAENRTVELYRCEEFPHRWQLHQVLLDNIDAVDATLWQEDDRWWMFVNVAEPGVDNTDELHLYWSTTPFGPWIAHRGNPVVSDVRCARPAGPLFARDGSLFRPSQDCSVAYGHSVQINRVENLSEDGYREMQVDRIAPGWRNDILRVHTVGASKRLRVLDCVVRR